MHQFFVDSLNALASQLQSNAMHILTHPKKASQKIQGFTMQLVQFKHGMLSLLQKFVKELEDSWKNKSTAKTSKVIEELQDEIVKNSDKLNRYRLHQILKRKVEKKKRQSMISSSFGKDESVINQLQKSVILIEKDLGIQPQIDSISDRLGLSAVISRSLLESTPVRVEKLRDYSIISQTESIPVQQSGVFELEGTSQKRWKQNVGLNKQQTSNQQKIQQKTSSNSATIPKKAGGTAKKVKKTVFSKGQTKEGLLGNLLQQTYNSCLPKK